MEKISGILPSSHRTRKVDTSKSQPVRPGAPSFGRSEGKNSLGQKAIEDRLTLAEERLGTPTTYRNTKDNMQAQMVTELSKKFFNSTPAPTSSVIAESEVAQSEDLDVEPKQSEPAELEVSKDAMSASEIAEVINEAP